MNIQHNHFAATNTTQQQGTQATPQDLAQIVLGNDYLWVLLSVIWIGFQCLLHGFIYGGGARKNAFTKEFLEENFGAEHKQMTGGQGIDKNGYPDTGSGKYSQKLSYEKWYKFNCSQRIHLNYVEGIATIIIITLVAGVFQPIVAAITAGVYIVGRQLVAFGYQQSAGFISKVRTTGIIIVDLAILTNFIVANYGIFSHLNY